MWFPFLLSVRWCPILSFRFWCLFLSLRHLVLILPRRWKSQVQLGQGQQQCVALAYFLLPPIFNFILTWFDFFSEKFCLYIFSLLLNSFPRFPCWVACVAGVSCWVLIAELCPGVYLVWLWHIISLAFPSLVSLLTHTPARCCLLAGDQRGARRGAGRRWVKSFAILYCLHRYSFFRRHNAASEWWTVRRKVNKRKLSNKNNALCLLFSISFCHDMNFVHFPFLCAYNYLLYRHCSYLSPRHRDVFGKITPSARRLGKLHTRKENKMDAAVDGRL